MDIDKILEENSKSLDLTEEEIKIIKPVIKTFAEFLNLMFKEPSEKQNIGK